MAPKDKESSLVKYGHEELMKAFWCVHDTVDPEHRPKYELGLYRGTRVGAALYQVGSGNVVALLAFHFKDPKMDWWPSECARLQYLWHLTMRNLCPDCLVVMGGDTNLPNMEAAQMTRLLLHKNYKLSMGNVSSLMSMVAGQPGLGIEETSRRARNAFVALKQFSKVDRMGCGKKESAAKITFVVDADSHWSSDGLSKAGWAMLIFFFVCFLLAVVAVSLLPAVGDSALEARNNE